MEVFTKDSYKYFLKENMHNKRGEFAKIANELEFEAERRMTNPLYSVTFDKSKALSGDVHDYYSEAPYWWPDEKNPGGAFVRRDGQFNPDRFVKHSKSMEQMAEDMYILTLAGFMFDEEKYTERAIKLLDTWFVDSKTKMNPHLEYAQAIYKVTPGRGIGIIDTVNLLKVIAAIDYITQSDKYNSCVEGVRDWFNSYRTWMNTSKNGLEEKEYPNNHSNWWNAQMASYSAFCGDEKMKKESFNRLTEKLLPSQTGDDGEFIDEMTRTNSLHYCFYNLSATAITAEVAYNSGVDLWNKTLEGDKGIVKSLEFMYPYYENPYLWRHKQISGNNFGIMLAFQLAAKHVDKKYARANKIRRSGMAYFDRVKFIGAECFVEGFFEED